MLQRSNLASQRFCVIVFNLDSFKLTRKMPRINLFMGLCANTFTLVHSFFEKSMENILSSGFSCSVPNLASAKVRNVADLKIIELQNQYLNKKLLSSSWRALCWKQSQRPYHRCQSRHKRTRNTYILLNITPFLLLCTAFLLLAPLQSRDLLWQHNSKILKTLLFYPCIVSAFLPVHCFVSGEQNYLWILAACRNL